MVLSPKQIIFVNVSGGFKVRARLATLGTDKPDWRGFSHRSRHQESFLLLFFTIRQRLDPPKTSKWSVQNSNLGIEQMTRIGGFGRFQKESVLIRCKLRASLDSMSTLMVSCVENHLQRLLRTQARMIPHILSRILQG